MERFMKITSKLIPEIITIAERRYNILREINNGPIGRRNLAQKLAEGERTIRNELDFLSDERLIEITAAGAQLTGEGRELLNELVDYIKIIKGLRGLEQEIREILGISHVLIVPSANDAELDKRELGRFAAKELKKVITQQEQRRGQITIAVTGGTTMAEVADMMNWDGEHRQLMVVPGRGGLGEDVEIQANTIASKLAKKLGGHHRLLHIQDNLQELTLQTISKEPQIKEVLDLLAHASILVHGVGTAREMARRRGLTGEELKHLEQVGAVGEAFGFYFNERSEIVYSTTSVGLKLDDLARKDLLVIAIAEGEEKARAILSVVSPEYHDILITDEKTAKEILELAKS